MFFMRFSLFFIFLILFFSISKPLAQENIQLEERKEFFEPLPEELIKHLPPDINQQIAYFVKVFTTEKREVTERWFRRCGRFLPYFKAVFTEEGLPEDLAYLAMVESGCNPFAVSRAGAVGIWQFIESTAKNYGLKINFWIDERRDFMASTRAAAKYLKRLYQIFGDWRIAVASYNAGEGRILRGLKAKNFSDYWKAMMEGAFPLETFTYVPQWLAISILAKNPEKYKLPPIEEIPLDLDVVEVPGGFELKSLALAGGIDPELFFFINAKYRRGFTPPEPLAPVLIPYENKNLILNNLYSLPWRKIEANQGETKIILYALEEEVAKRVLEELFSSPQNKTSSPSSKISKRNNPSHKKKRK